MKIRKGLLTKMLKIESISGEEEEITKLVVKELEILGFSISIDTIGNVSAIRGSAKKYPLLNAHMDIVDIRYDYMDYMYWYEKSTSMDTATRNTIIQDVLNTLTESQMADYNLHCYHCTKSFDKKCPNNKLNMLCHEFTPTLFGESKILEIADDLGFIDSGDLEPDVDKYATYITEDEEEYTVYTDKKGMIRGKGKQRVLGGDDKCGIFIALEVARITKNLPMKILFTVQEETGLVGIKDFIKHNIKWFDDVAYSITIDRRDTNHLLWAQCGKRSCDNEFASKMAMAGVKAGIPIQVQDGGVSDTISIRELVNAVNISAGYFEAHTEDEYIDYGAVKRIINWVKIFVTEY